MLKEFIEHIQKTAQPTIRVEEGRTYIVATDGSYREMVPRAIAPDGIELNSLDALVTLVRTEADGGMWKLHARQTVGEWLKEKLKVCIDRGLVMVAL